jgi:hypothetical protein
MLVDRAVLDGLRREAAALRDAATGKPKESGKPNAGGTPEPVPTPGGLLKTVTPAKKV